MYFPQKIGNQDDKNAIKTIKEKITKNQKPYISLKHPNITGRNPRMDHNIIVSNKDLTEIFIKSHDQACRHFLKFKRFRKFQNWFF